MKFILPDPLQSQASIGERFPLSEERDLLPFLRATCITGAFGEIYQQQTPTDVYTIYLHSFRMKQAIRLQTIVSEPMVTLSYALKGNLTFLLNGSQKTLIQNGWYHLYYIPAGNYTVQMPEGEVVIFQINLPAKLIQGLGQNNQVMREVLENILTNSRRGLQQDAAEITPKVNSILDSIYSCELNEAERDIFLHARICDLLLLYLSAMNETQKDFCTKYHFSPEDLQSLRAAGAILAGELHKPIQLEEIARQVHLHVRKLTAGFRMLYGVSVYEWLTEVRMERAKQLLQNGHINIHDIAYEVGYNSASGFIRAFKTFTGYTPAHYQK